MKYADLLKESYEGKPNNFEKRKEEALTELKEEIKKRRETILYIPRFDRRLDKRNYKFVKFIKERDGKQCKKCGKKDKDVKYEVSHILPVEIFPEYAFEKWNARMECHSCNHKDGTPSFRRMANDIQRLKIFCNTLAKL